ncbi:MULTISPECIES: putative quinol monooxygenase [Pseudomonas]|uniref:Antibiotic biosynthesis monooxygenase n=3 Tax=Pseudomonas TaxID=286 RepID=A0A0G3GSH1_9PSED|nr:MULTISPECIES: putative quinol monooxygenase [Pseudomonas]AKK01752.1 antibiotic biosynthesis monooxygenase [Pseudomonas chlororaphis]KIQ56852.1 antibiotic biosynthesis monooxygenase [Pseudomonas fluorescens]ROM87239.1 antibiotic biosynthesis monooxygenase [Pseudomonas brassicacearum]BBP63528.1 hypothetical protein PHLH5_10690 [Pseudomonas sp. Cab53]
MTTQIPVSHMVFVRARSGCSKQLGARLSTLVAPSRQSPGCLHFALQQSQCDADLWLVSGLWTHQQVMEAYFNSPAMAIFSALVQDLVVSSLDFHTFREVSAAQATEGCLATVHKLAG